MRGISVIFLLLMLGACTSMHSPILSGSDSRQLLTNDDLRSAVMGKVITFPDGEAVTGYECYIFERSGEAFVCGREGKADYGQITIFEDRICAGPEDSICWQIYRGRNGDHFIRHLAFEPNFVDEEIHIADWVSADRSR